VTNRLTLAWSVLLNAFLGIFINTCWHCSALLWSLLYEEHVKDRGVYGGLYAASLKISFLRPQLEFKKNGPLKEWSCKGSIARSE